MYYQIIYVTAAVLILSNFTFANFDDGDIERLLLDI